MKNIFTKLLLISAVASSFMLWGCRVDKDYDLGKISGDETVFGDIFVGPLGRGTIDLGDIIPIEDILDQFNLSLDDLPNIPIQPPAGQHTTKYRLDVALDSDIKDALIETGEIGLKCDLENNTPIDLTVTFNFHAASGASFNLTPMEVPGTGSGSSNKSEYRETLTKEEVEMLSESERLEITYDYSFPGPAIVSLDMDMRFDFMFLKTGGIKL